MTKGEAKELILKINDECDKHDDCSDCAFYNLNKYNDGCIWEHLLYCQLPEKFKEVLEDE